MWAVVLLCFVVSSTFGYEEVANVSQLQNLSTISWKDNETFAADNASSFGDGLEPTLQKQTVEQAEEEQKRFKKDTFESQKNQTEKGDHEGGIHIATWKWDYVKTPFIYTAFVIAAGLLKVVYHHADYLSTVIPESCILIILGTIVGVIVYFNNAGSSFPQFTSDTFFLYLLPPIILDSAYSLHDRAFFSNLGTILLYAVVGTLFNFITIGFTLFGLTQIMDMGLGMPIGTIDCLTFSALLSAVDPVAVLAIFQEIGVNKVLYFLVFGESLLNDAVTVVIYTMVVAFADGGPVTAGQVFKGIAAFLCVSLGGLSIGIFMGILTALVTKQTLGVRVVEPLAILGIAYLSYLVAEMVHFSGIISIIGCGLTQAQYAQHNISEKSRTTVKYFTRMLSAVCDTVIFLFLGMVLVSNKHLWSTALVLWTNALCLIYRFAGVFLLTYIVNKVEKVRCINEEEQFIMAYGGLRGAVAFSLVIMLDEEKIRPKPFFVTATLFIILFTVFIQGVTIRPLVNLLKIRKENKYGASLFTEINTKLLDNVMAGIEEVTGTHGDNYWKHLMHKYDEKYLQKWLIHENSKHNLTLVYSKMVLADHFAHLYGPATAIEDKVPLNLYGNDNKEDPETDEKKDGVKQVRFTSDEPHVIFKIEDPKSPEPTSPASDSRASFARGRRHTISNAMRRMSIRRLSSGSVKVKEPDDPNKLLKRALTGNPYYRLHQKYNPNLIDEEEQELENHLKARHLRARRLTLAAIQQIPSLNNSLDDETSTDTTEVQTTTTPADSSDTSRPTSAPVVVPDRSKLYGDSLYNGANYFVQRHQRRRSLMSSKKVRPSKQVKIAEESEDSHKNGSDRRWHSRRNPGEEPKQRNQSISLHSIVEEGGGDSGSVTPEMEHHGRARGRVLEKSHTFDLGENGHHGGPL